MSLKVIDDLFDLKKKIMLKMDKDTINKIKVESAKEGMTNSNYVQEVLEYYWNEKGE